MVRIINSHRPNCLYIHRSNYGYIYTPNGKKHRLSKIRMRMIYHYQKVSKEFIHKCFWELIEKLKIDIEIFKH